MASEQQRRDGDALLPAGGGGGVMSEDEVDAVLRLPLNHFDAALVTRLLATLDAARAKLAEVERDRDRLQGEYDAVATGVGHSLVMSWPLCVSVERQLAAERATLAEAESLLRDAKDSLEYVDTAHPGTTGWGVRRERVAQIAAWLAARAPTEPHA